MENIKNYDLDKLKAIFTEDLSEKSYRAEQVFKWLYVDKVDTFDEMTNLSLDLRKKLNEKFEISAYTIKTKQSSKDGTKKYLLELNDGNAVETVLMEYKYGRTICVSTQVGCKMGCRFCASTGLPFVRSLTSAEIVDQILVVEKDEKIRISNVVFMGIGEPFDNYENVINAIKILNNQKGLSIGARHISISTSGLVPCIYRLADENIQCSLSISLHCTNNEKRSEIMPVNRKYNIEELMKACKYYIEKTNRRISFEYALLCGENDTVADADGLVKLLSGMLCYVNLIPVNKIENEPFKKTADKNVIKFRDYLNEKGINATIRRELGSDIDAACGQLRRKSVKDK